VGKPDCLPTRRQRPDHRLRGGNNTRILGGVSVAAQNAAEYLNRLLEKIVSRMPAPELSALDSYRALLRDHVVIHRATAELFRRVNEEALALGRRPVGASGLTYEATLPPWNGNGHHWIGLRPDDDLAEHASRLLTDIRSAVPG